MDPDCHDGVPCLDEGGVLHLLTPDGAKLSVAIERAGDVEDLDVVPGERRGLQVLIGSDGRLYLLTRWADGPVDLEEYPDRRALCRSPWARNPEEPAVVSLLLDMGALKFKS